MRSTHYPVTKKMMRSKKMKNCQRERKERHDVLISKVTLDGFFCVFALVFKYTCVFNIVFVIARGLLKI